MRAFFVAIFFLFMGSQADAQNLSASNPESIVEAIRELGFRAAYNSEDLDAPYIESAADGSTFQITFGGCEQGLKCTWLLFNDAYTYEKKDILAIKNVVDKWNAEMFSKAFIDDDGVYIDYFLIVSEEGMGKKLFERNFYTWILDLVNFRKQLVEASNEK